MISNIRVFRFDAIRLSKQVIAVAATCTVLAGCSTLEGTWVGGWIGVNKVQKLPTIKDSNISLQWSTSVGKTGGFEFSPGFGDKVIYTVAHNGKINVLADNGGKNVTQLNAKAFISAGVGAAEDTIVVVGTKGEVIALDGTGKLLWKTELVAEILAPPLVSGTNVLVRTADGRMFALNRADGKRRWVFTRASPTLTLRSSANVVVKGGVIYAGYPGGKLVAIELDSGRPIWEATLSQPRGATELERVADVAGLPAYDDSRVCAAVYQGRTGCVETLNGNVLWTRDISSADGAVVNAKYLFVTDTQGNVIALDKTSGASVWKQEKLVRRDPGTLLILKDAMLLSDKNGLIHAMATDTGELTGRVQTDGSRVISLVAFGDRAIAQTEKGGLYSIAVR